MKTIAESAFHTDHQWPRRSIYMYVPVTRSLDRAGWKRGCIKKEVPFGCMHCLTPFLLETRCCTVVSSTVERRGIESEERSSRIHVHVPCYVYYATAVAVLRSSVKISINTRWLGWGDFSDLRFGWILENPGNIFFCYFFCGLLVLGVFIAHRNYYVLIH